MQKKSGGFEFVVALESGEKVAVLMARRQFNSGDRVAIVGSIINDPQSRIAGYLGTVPTVVYSKYGHAIARGSGPQRPAAGRSLMDPSPRSTMYGL